MEQLILTHSNEEDFDGSMNIDYIKFIFVYYRYNPKYYVGGFAAFRVNSIKIACGK